MEKDLRHFLDTAKPWARISTRTPGLFIRKMPKSKKKPSYLAIELNPADNKGKPTKKNGIFIRSKQDVEEFKKLLKASQIEKILKAIEKVNPT